MYSPDGTRETGLPCLPSEKKAPRLARPRCERHFLRSALRERFAQLAANSNDFPKIVGWFLCTSDCMAEGETFRRYSLLSRKARRVRRLRESCYSKHSPRLRPNRAVVLTSAVWAWVRTANSWRSCGREWSPVCAGPRELVSTTARLAGSLEIELLSGGGRMYRGGFLAILICDARYFLATAGTVHSFWLADKPGIITWVLESKRRV
jgi:hypothetical protein